MMGKRQRLQFAVALNKEFQNATARISTKTFRNRLFDADDSITFSNFQKSRK